MITEQDDDANAALLKVNELVVDASRVFTLGRQITGGKQRVVRAKIENLEQSSQRLATSVNVADSDEPAHGQ